MSPNGPRVDAPLPYAQTQSHQPPPVYNDPPPDSLFGRLSERNNRCSICGGITSNNTEGRDGHLNRYGCHATTEANR